MFRQDDSVWGNEPAGSNTFSKDGGPRTLIATIMRSFGAKVTPKNFSGCSGTSRDWALEKAKSFIKQLNLKLEISSKITSSSQFESKIKDTLRGGGAVLIQTGSSGIFGSRHLALLDIETVGKKEFVFLADSKGDTAASGDSSVKINVMVPLSDILEKGKISAIWTFKNKSSTTCSGSSFTPGRPEQELQ